MTTGLTGRLHFTIHNEGQRNPHCVALIEVMKQVGRAAVVLDTASQFELLANHPEAVALFDVNAGGKVNHWRPTCLDVSVPSWARMGCWAVMVSPRCVASPMAIERAVRQITQMNHPWGPPRTAKRKPRREQRPARYALW